MTQVNKSSSSQSTKSHSPKSQDSKPARSTSNTVQPQATRAARASASSTRPALRDSFTAARPSPSKASAGKSSSSSSTASTSSTASSYRTLSAQGGGAAKPPEPIGQVGGVHGNGGRKDTDYDGGLIDGQGNVYPPGTPRDGLTPVGPTNGKTPTETVYYVNGIQNDAAYQTTSMQNAANALGVNVFGIHNATGGNNPLGFVRDLVQCLTDKTPLLQYTNNNATASLALNIAQDLRDGKPVHLLAHSQGGLVTSNALSLVKDALVQTYGPQKADEMLSTIKVETFGGAAASYPYGPQYVHYVNEYDPVPMQTGLGSISDPVARQAAAGGDRAAFHFIRDDPRRPVAGGVNFDSHDFNQGYLAHRLPFEQGQASNVDLQNAPSPVDVNGQTVHYAEPANHPAEVAERQASEAAANSAHALADAQAAMLRGDVATARREAARAAELAQVAQQAAARTPALVQGSIEAAYQEFDKAVQQRDLVFSYVSNGRPVPQGLPSLEQAEARVGKAVNLLSDLNTAVKDSRRAAEQSQRQAQQAAEYAVLAEQGLPPEVARQVANQPPSEAGPRAVQLTRDEARLTTERNALAAPGYTDRTQWALERAANSGDPAVLQAVNASVSEAYTARREVEQLAQQALRTTDLKTLLDLKARSDAALQRLTRAVEDAERATQRAA